MLSPSAYREGKVCALALAQFAILCLHGGHGVHAMEHCSATRCALTYGECERAAVSPPWAALDWSNHLLHPTNPAIATSSSCPCRKHSGKDLHRHPWPYDHSAFWTSCVANLCSVPRYHAPARLYQRGFILNFCVPRFEDFLCSVSALIILMESIDFKFFF